MVQPLNLCERERARGREGGREGGRESERTGFSSSMRGKVSLAYVASGIRFKVSFNPSCQPKEQQVGFHIFFFIAKKKYVYCHL